MDTKLVLEAQRGDEEAFASLAVAVGDRLHAVAHRILRDTDLAEDATQQALLSIWRDLPQLRDPARFDAWSYRLLVRANPAMDTESPTAAGRRAVGGRGPGPGR
jgi:RNA polymerase sigma-70 factor (ECF subfamily)